MKTPILRLACAILFFGIIATACSKPDSKPRVEGTIREFGTSSVLSEVKVELFARRPGFLGSSMVPIGSSTTDNKGNYLLKFSTDPEDMEYSISIFKERYIHIEFHPLDEIKGLTDGKLMKDFVLPPKAVIRLHIKNASPEDDYDYFTYSFSCPTVESMYPTFFPWHTISCDPLGPRGFMGMDINTLCTIEVPGNMDNIITWSATKKGNHTGGEKKALYCAGGTTMDYYINY